MARQMIKDGDEHISACKTTDREFYSIPRSAGWFSWDEIHQTERLELPEFFDGSSVSKNTRAYKEYRDFIINKYREDPSRRLTFTEVRKSLVADVGSLRKVFLFLYRWGLINFSAASTAASAEAVLDVGKGPVVVTEEGAPAGVRVVQSSLGGLLAVAAGTAVDAGDGGFKLPPLASYTNVLCDDTRGNGLVSGVCGIHCESEEFGKGSLVRCSKCTAKEETAGDQSDNVDDKDQDACSWTDAETLFLLEAVLKHGDDWDLISQHVKTKSKDMCIARLIQLPFGDRLFNAVGPKGEIKNSINQTSIVNTKEQPLIKQFQDSNSDDTRVACTNEINAKESVQEHPLKRRRITFSVENATGSLMQQVARLSAVAGKHVASVSMDASLLALCQESPYASRVFIGDMVVVTTKSESSLLNGTLDDEMKSVIQTLENDLEKECASEKDLVAAAFRIRAAIAAALGAAAARAKLTADSEEVEMRQFMATVIDMQLKKIEHKIKHLEEAERIMEEEFALIQHLKQSILDDWFRVLHKMFEEGVGRWKDRVIPWSLLNSAL